MSWYHGSLGPTISHMKSDFGTSKDGTRSHSTKNSCFSMFFGMSSKDPIFAIASVALLFNLGIFSRDMSRKYSLRSLASFL
jgi:hypothetical protein